MSKLSRFLNSALSNAEDFGIYHYYETFIIYKISSVNAVMGMCTTNEEQKELLDEGLVSLLTRDMFGRLEYKNYERSVSGRYFFEVIAADAVYGCGPFLYAAAMKVLPNGICPDQDFGQLSPDAQRVWQRIYDDAQNDSNYVLTPIKNAEYMEPYRNFFYKIVGSSIADIPLKNSESFIKELEEKGFR